MVTQLFKKIIAIVLECTSLASRQPVTDSYSEGVEFSDTCRQPHTLHIYDHFSAILVTT